MEQDGLLYISTRKSHNFQSIEWIKKHPLPAGDTCLTPAWHLPDTCLTPAWNLPVEYDYIHVFNYFICTCDAIVLVKHEETTPVCFQYAILSETISPLLTTLMRVWFAIENQSRRYIALYSFRSKMRTFHHSECFSVRGDDWWRMWIDSKLHLQWHVRAESVTGCMYRDWHLELSPLWW